MANLLDIDAPHFVLACQFHRGTWCTGGSHETMQGASCGLNLYSKYIRSEFLVNVYAKSSVFFGNEKFLRFRLIAHIKRNLPAVHNFRVCQIIAV